MEDLAGRVAVVTGGAGGVGQALGARLAAEGMRVVLADLFPDPLEEAAAGLRADGHDVTGRGHRRDRAGVGRAPGRRGLRDLRRGPPAVQQRRRGRRGRGQDLGPHGQRLGLGPGGEPVGRHPRDQGVRAPHARRRRRGPRHEHLVGQRRHRAADRHRHLRHHEGRGHDGQRGALRPAASGGQPHRRLGAVPGPEGAAHRPARLVAPSGPSSGPTSVPAPTPYTTIESFEARLRAAGIEPDYTPVEAVADEAVARHPRGPVLDPARQRAHRRHHPGPRRVDARPLGARPTWRNCDEPLPRDLRRHPRRPARTRVPRVARPRVPRPVRRVRRRAGAGRRDGPHRLPQRGVRRGLARGERGGPARRLGRRPARQGARRRRRGRRGHLPRRRLGHRWGVGTVRRRAGRQRRHPGRAAPRRRPGPQPLAGRAVPGQPGAAGRRGGRADHGRRRRRGGRDPPGPRVGAAGRHPHPADVAAARAVPPPPLRPGVGGVRGAADAGARALRRGRPGVLRPARRHLHHRDPVLVVPTAAVPHLVGRVRALPRSALRRGRVRGLLGERPALADGPRLRARPRLAEAGRPADREHVDEPERVLRPQLLHRRVEHRAGRAGPPLRDRRRQPLLGQRLPPPRGHLAPHA